MTSEKLAQVQAAVTAELQRRQVEALPLDVMHAALFDGTDPDTDPGTANGSGSVSGLGLGLGYTLELFLEDCQSFSLKKHGEMSLDEALEFLREMQ